MTYREFCLLYDVKHEIRTLRAEANIFKRENIAGLEAHLRAMGVEV